MHDAQQCRLERSRQQDAGQAARNQRVLRDGKALRAAASAIVNSSMAFRMVGQGLTHDPTPPIPMHAPGE